ncbi:amidohydrolase family protein [Vibrio ostreicida]|uniref:Amidohydrolase family protein n=1 Tax=Vibrio ostreicida TaxID=526588 RepID=A0ABT8C2I1_9VIBR|nr:amidohydrolase family protein [Vibrio ostreicida]MDN3612547.1 amidohydrolase family protein [Vibrio ostreicida]NPD09168.1 amidohydrolase family protein [Vibrio ostreicida]
MNRLLIKNVRLADHDDVKQLLIEDGHFQQISDNASPLSFDGDVIDAEGGLAVAPFCEPHIHLDTTQTAGEPSWNVSGTLFEGIERWAERKQTLSIADVKSRAIQTLKWQIANGVQHVRTHVDVSDPSLIALRAMIEVRQEMKDWVDIQIVAFPQEGILSYPNGKALLEQAMTLGADVVGAIPHFEFTREYGVESLHFVFELAAKKGCLIDVHCDEIDDEQSRLFRLLRLSGIHFVANPLVNIHLQGRFDDYPKRRGVTRVKEMLAVGINVCFGHDDVFDPWYPLGTANMLQVLHMGLHVCQLMGYDQINHSLDLISHHSARAMNLVPNYGIELHKPGSLVILPAENGFDAVRRQVPVRYSIRHGRVIAQTQPAKTTLYLDQAEEISFRRS